MDELYIIARAVLLDALEALGSHRDAVVVVGAQAIYLQIGDTELAIAAYTTDGDLGLDPGLLAETPALESALAAAELAPPSAGMVGMWTKRVELSDGTPANVTVDLLVPRALSPEAGRRAAPLRGHHKLAARAVVGLEGVVVDFDRKEISSLDPRDSRSFSVRVAGPAALLIAKLHKIFERASGHRAKDKDALDVFRLLRHSESVEIARRLGTLRSDARSDAVTERGIELLRNLFGNRAGVGIAMLVRATEQLMDPEEVTAACLALVTDLLEQLGRQ